MDIIEMPVAELIPYENNPRKNDGAVEAVANSIKEFGFKVPIIIDKDNVIVAGHTRMKAAEKLWLESVPVIKADDLNEEQIRAFRLADNKTYELAGWDFTELERELEKLKDIDMSLFGFEELTDNIEAEKERKDIGESVEQYQLVIDCEDEDDLQKKYDAILEIGIECRVLTL